MDFRPNKNVRVQYTIQNLLAIFFISDETMDKYVTKILFWLASSAILSRITGQYWGSERKREGQAGRGKYRTPIRNLRFTYLAARPMMKHERTSEQPMHYRASGDSIRGLTEFSQMLSILLIQSIL